MLDICNGHIPMGIESLSTIFGVVIALRVLNQIGHMNVELRSDKFGADSGSGMVIQVTSWCLQVRAYMTSTVQGRAGRGAAV